MTINMKLIDLIEPLKSMSTAIQLAEQGLHGVEFNAISIYISPPIYGPGNSGGICNNL
jgi:hypothetical protein